MNDDISRNKSEIIRRCLGRIREEFRDDPARLDDFTVQDSVILNLLRACEAAIDRAMHEVAVRQLGVPQNSREAFTLLEQAGTLDSATATSMRHMVGFRNIAVRSYQQIERPILEAILIRHLNDFETFLDDLAGTD